MYLCCVTRTFFVFTSMLQVGFQWAIWDRVVLLFCAKGRRQLDFAFALCCFCVFFYRFDWSSTWKCWGWPVHPEKVLLALWSPFGFNTIQLWMPLSMGMLLQCSLWKIEARGARLLFELYLNQYLPYTFPLSLLVVGQGWIKLLRSFGTTSFSFFLALIPWQGCSTETKVYCQDLFKT